MIYYIYKYKYIYIQRCEKTKICPFYTIFNAFLSAVVRRVQLGQYLSIIITRYLKKKNDLLENKECLLYKGKGLLHLCERKEWNLITESIMYVVKIYIMPSYES